jgi:hypothetical protein
MSETITYSRSGIERWDNGKKVSTDNAFRLGYVGKPHNFVADLERHGKARATSANQRAKRIASGTDRSAIAGLSKKADDMLAERRTAQIQPPYVLDGMPRRTRARARCLADRGSTARGCRRDRRQRGRRAR